MKKTTLYLPDELAAALKQHAADSHIRESELVRMALYVFLKTKSSPKK